MKQEIMLINGRWLDSVNVNACQKKNWKFKNVKATLINKSFHTVAALCRWYKF